MNDYFVCNEHAYALAMPGSGRCQECIAEDNKEKRAYLEKALEGAERSAEWRHKRIVPTTKDGLEKRLLTCLHNFTARAKLHGWQHVRETVPITVDDLERLLESQDGTCNGCLASFEDVDLSLDHITPVIYGGRHTPRNLQLLCQACNSSKKDRPNADWLSDLRYRQVTRHLQDIAEEEAIISP